MRALHFIYDDPGNPWVGGGGAVRVREIYRRISRADADVTVITGNYPGARDEEVDGVRYRRVGARGPYAWSRLTYAQAASKLLAHADYDVAVFDFSTYTPLRWPRARPVGVTVHHLSAATVHERWGRLAAAVLGRMELRTLRRARFFTATSRVMQEHLRSVLPADAHIALVQAGVPDELFGLERRADDYLLYFGRIDWFHKGLDTLVEAIALVARDRPGVLLKVAGRGRDMERVRSGVQDANLHANVELLGAVDDAQRAALFAGARMLIMPSRFEGFGLAAAEAMAAGVPVIASDAGSLPEVVDAPKGGVIVPAGDASALARAIVELLDDVQRQARMTVSARASAQRFRWQHIAGQHLAFLHAIKEGSSR